MLVGAQVNPPLVGLMIAPAGAPGSKLKVRILVGLSGSVAEFVTLNSDPAKATWSAIDANSGGLFTSSTTTVKLTKALSGGVPSSATLTTIIFVLGPCASVGVQVKTPVFGFRLTPVGADAKLNVSRLAGRSASVAAIVTISVLSSAIL